MARVIIHGDFEIARQKLQSIGITLTKRTHRKGGFVCYANKQLRQSMARMLALKQLPQNDIFISGAL